MNRFHPAHIYAIAEALAAVVCAFAPLSGTQVATILGFIAVVTGHRVKQKVQS